MTATLSAIVVNYNSGNLLRTCIDSLTNCPLTVEIIVIDNASSDQSLVGIEITAGIRVVKNQINVGFAAACNQGVTYAKGDYLLFLNPDCSFEKGALVQLLHTIRSGKKIGMVGGLLVNPDGSEQGGGRRAVPTPWRSFVRAFGLSFLAKNWPKWFSDFYLHKEPLPADPIEVEAISGACMLVKRDAINEVGLWDEGYFLHCEDLDWCMRFREHGWLIYFVPTARVVHGLGGCSRRRPIFVEWHKHRGMMRFYRKFFRHQYPGILMWIVALGIWLHFAIISSFQFLKLVFGYLTQAESNVNETS